MKEYNQKYETLQNLAKTQVLSTTYLGKSDRSKNDKIKVEESFPISEQGCTLGKLLDRTECQILLDTGASKSSLL